MITTHALRSQFPTARPRAARLLVAGLGSAVLMMVTSVASARAEAAPPPKPPWKAPHRAARKKNPMAADAASLRLGRQIFARECIACHGKDGRGGGTKAAELDTRPGDLSSAAVDAQSDGALYWKITRGRAPMASFKTLLTEQERWHVVNFIRTLAAASPPVTPPTFNVPERYRRAVSAVLKPYLKIRAALAKGDLTAARGPIGELAAAGGQLSAAETEELQEKALARWRTDLGAVTSGIEALSSTKDLRSIRHGFADLSAALARTIGDFGHAEKTALRLYAETTASDGGPAIWLQAARQPESPYGPAKSGRPVTLRKVLGGVLATRS